MIGDGNRKGKSDFVLGNPSVTPKLIQIILGRSISIVF